VLLFVTLVMPASVLTSHRFRLPGQLCSCHVLLWLHMYKNLPRTSCRRIKLPPNISLLCASDKMSTDVTHRSDRGFFLYFDTWHW